jgi:hypothetical protein
MSATNDQASSSKRPLPTDTDAEVQPSATKSISSQRVFRVYKPLGGSVANGKKSKAAAAAAKSRKGGFFSDRFDRSVLMIAKRVYG